MIGFVIVQYRQHDPCVLGLFHMKRSIKRIFQRRILCRVRSPCPPRPVGKHRLGNAKSRGPPKTAPGMRSNAHPLLRRVSDQAHIHLRFVTYNNVLSNRLIFNKGYLILRFRTTSVAIHILWHAACLNVFFIVICQIRELAEEEMLQDVDLYFE